MADIFQKCRDFKQADQAKATGCYPYFRKIQGSVGNSVIVEGKPRLMIGSNNYLGLASDPRVLQSARDAVTRYGSGCTGSRFLNGNMEIHEELEEKLARLLKKESVLLFSTGFFANQGALATLCDSGEFILSDRENHASIIEGCNVSRAKMVPYAHNSRAALERRMSFLPPEAGKLVVADGVFSMSGDVVDLPMLVDVAKKNQARTYIDEAHSLGVFGPKGEGICHHFGLNDQVDLIMGTFSKSLGSMGGFIAGPHVVVNYLRHVARCMIFTASLAPAVVGGVLKALELMQTEPERRDQLWKNTKKMHEGFRSLGFNIGTTQSPVVPILIGSETKAFLFTQKLFEKGIFATPAVYPAVKYGLAIVRTSYMATHTDSELDYVLETFKTIGQELGIFSDEAYKGGKGIKASGGFDFSMDEEAAATEEA